MADPLSLLREYVSSNKIDEVVVNGDRVDFGGKFTFSKNTPTGYKSQQVRSTNECTAFRGRWCPCGTQGHRFAASADCCRCWSHLRAISCQPIASLPYSPLLQGKGNFYDLGTLLFFARNINVKFTEYFKKAREEAGAAVTFVDRKVGPLAAVVGRAGCAALPGSLPLRPVLLDQGLEGVPGSRTRRRRGPAMMNAMLRFKCACFGAQAGSLLFTHPLLRLPAHPLRRTCKST